MATTQKILLVAVLFNLIVAVAYSTTSTDAQKAIDAYNKEQDQKANNLRTEGQWTLPVLGTLFNMVADVWDVVKIASTFLWVFIKGFALPLVGNTSNTIENIIVSLINIFRMTMWLILFLEAYMLYRNRKTSS